ncbi:MAG TPA: cob(I)yrinic acid a,c-diamide adenosyltransferase [Saprospiraceae bacterium]|nr:cob(I)yrinic acid a,c-diamide adenosyltransferase [Saprospiraceae bacterium]HMP25794.1 cob(I)yrinic acid a,c-diamide adenosyltransferase [Saprospiraceae bacterium]
MAQKIYTKTGDQGETSLFGGKRLPKHHLRIEAYGTVDELNSWVGLLRDSTADESVQSLLKNVQDRLFTLGSNLASDPDKDMLTPDILEADVTALETAMDEMNETLPPLKNFILPGGHPTVSHAHIARCVCRRAERQVVALAQNEPVEMIVVRYLNRLSDYLFVLARKLATDLGAAEVVWKPRG